VREFEAATSPINVADRLHAIARMADIYNLDDNYCVYCSARLTLGGWRFVCDDCRGYVAHFEYNMAAVWINELFIDVYGKTNNTLQFVRRRHASVPRGALHGR
jgi:hypothetical protein